MLPESPANESRTLLALRLLGAAMSGASARSLGKGEAAGGGKAPGIEDA